MISARENHHAIPPLFYVQFVEIGHAVEMYLSGRGILSMSCYIAISSKDGTPDEAVEYYHISGCITGIALCPQLDPPQTSQRLYIASPRTTAGTRAANGAAILHPALSSSSPSSSVPLASASLAVRDSVAFADSLSPSQLSFRGVGRGVASGRP